MVPHTILLEPLSECFVLGIFAAWSINFLFRIDPFAIYLFHVLVWFLLDYMLLNVIQVIIINFLFFFNEEQNFSVRLYFRLFQILLTTKKPIIFLSIFFSSVVIYRLAKQNMWGLGYLENFSLFYGLLRLF